MVRVLLVGIVGTPPKAVETAAMEVAMSMEPARRVAPQGSKLDLALKARSDTKTHTSRGILQHGGIELEGLLRGTIARNLAVKRDTKTDGADTVGALDGVDEGMAVSGRNRQGKERDLLEHVECSWRIENEGDACGGRGKVDRRTALRYGPAGGEEKNTRKRTRNGERGKASYQNLW